MPKLWKEYENDENIKTDEKIKQINSTHFRNWLSKNSCGVRIHSVSL